MKKKLLLALSMIALLVCLFAISVSATEVDGIDYTFNRTTMEAYVNSGNQDCKVVNVVINSTVTVTEEHTADDSYYGTYTVVRIDSSAFKGNGTVVSIVTPSTVRHIGTHAFREMTALEEITLNTSAEFTAFEDAEVYGCKALKKADLSGMVGLVDMGGGSTYDHTFVGCSSLTEVILPASLQIIGTRAFENCSSLTSITLHEGITTIRTGAFAGCGFVNVHLPSTVTYIGDYVFQGCRSLESLNIPVGVTNFGCNNFQYTKVTKVIFPSTVASAGKDMFNSVYCLDTLVIGCADVSNYNGSFLSSCGPLNNVFYGGSEPSVLTSKYSGLKYHELVTYEQYLKNLRNPEFEGYAGKVLVYGIETCSGCGDVVTAEHGFIFDSFIDKMYMGTECESCGKQTVTEEFAPVFVNLGYSTFTLNGYCSIVQGFKVNYESVDVYNAQFSSKTLTSYGVLAVAQSKVDGVAFDSEGNALDGVINAEIENELSYFEIKVVKIPTEGALDSGVDYVDAKLHICAYAKVGNEIYYISENYVGTTFGEAVSYNSLQK